MLAARSAMLDLDLQYYIESNIVSDPCETGFKTGLFINYKLIT